MLLGSKGERLNFFDKLDTEKFSISSLKAYTKNTRLHSEENIAAIMASLKRFGQQVPIVVNKQGEVIKGNGTLEAARRLGWTHIVGIKTQLTNLDELAYSIADNKTGETSFFDYGALSVALAELDRVEFDINALGFQEFELKALLHPDWRADESISIDDAKADSGPERQLKLVLDGEILVHAKRAKRLWDVSLRKEGAWLDFLVYLIERYLLDKDAARLAPQKKGVK